MENDADTIKNYRDPSFVLGWKPALAPIILTPPAALNIAMGQTATFTVTAAAVPEPAYQWQRNGVALKDGENVSGATTATLKLSSAATASAGNYTVVVTNASGSATSSPAALAVK
jgi:hypothetical protein